MQRCARQAGKRLELKAADASSSSPRGLEVNAVPVVQPIHGLASKEASTRARHLPEGT